MRIFYRQRYSKLVEILVSTTICVSYLGWLSAQLVALGMVVKLITHDTLSFELSMFIGLGIVMIYTMFGGMKSLIIMDFIQMFLIIIGLVSVAILVAGRFEGGVVEIVSIAHANNKFDIWPKTNVHDTFEFIAAFLTLALGSVPQQDIFQSAGRNGERDGRAQSVQTFATPAISSAALTRRLENRATVNQVNTATGTRNNRWRFILRQRTTSEQFGRLMLCLWKKM